MIAALLLAAASLQARTDTIVGDALRDAPAAGASVAVWRGGRIVLSKGYGFANVELRVPADARTVYRIGSITKQFTAAAILRLVEEGKLRLDQPVSEVLPEAPVQGRRVEIRHLLSHTSGIASYTSLGDRFWKRIREDFTTEGLMALFKDEPFHFEPGTRWEYSNSGYHLLGMVVEKISGQPYGEFLGKSVFPRAGLRATAVCDERAIVPHRASGYDSAGRELRNSASISMTVAFAAGNLCSTAEDLVRWTSALAAGKVVSAASYRQMATPFTLADGKPSSYGFGLGVSDLDGHASIGHGGGIDGFGGALTRFPDDDLTVAVLVNTTGEAASTIEERIDRVALGVPEPVVKDLPAPAEEIARWSGTYVTPGKRRLVIAARAGKLELRSEEDPADTTELLYQGGTDFVLKGSTRRVRFNENAGAVTSMSFGDGKRWFMELPRAP